MTFYNKTTLQNGTVVITETIPDVRSVSLGFWIGVGSRHEKPAENGISHFIEHLLFKGTKNRTAREISETFDRLGAEFNAFTSKEFTCCFARLIDEHLDIGIEMLTDILQNSLFDKEHIEFERQVVFEELAMYEDTPDELVHDLFTASLWRNHPLGQQVLGSKETVAGFNREGIMDYLDRNYGSANIVFTAAGNITHEQIVEQLDLHYKPTIADKTEAIEVEASVESGLEVFKRPTEQAHFCYGSLGIKSRDDDRFALSVLEDVLGGSMSSRLFQKVREERGLAYSIYSYHSLFLDTGNFVTYAGTRPGNVNQVLSIIGDELESLKADGITDEELARAKDHTKGQLVLALESTRNRMIRLGKSEMTHGEILSMDELVKRVNDVTTEQVKQLARRLFDPDKMMLTVIGPLEKSEIVMPGRSSGGADAGAQDG